MPRTIDLNAWQTAVSFAGPVEERGAEAAVLVGPHARGKRTHNTSIDIIALGEGPSHRLLRYNGFLVSLRWHTIEGVRAAFTVPALAPQTVGTWREAIFLLDSEGAAGWLQDEANAWTWDALPRPPEHIAAERLTVAAGEVHALIECLDAGDRAGASLRRAALVRDLPRLLAFHHHLIYPDDGELLSLLAARMGVAWSTVLHAALGLDDESFVESCRAAITLYSVAARTIGPDLEAWQRDVVEQAMGLGEAPRRAASPGSLRAQE